ncbi:MAG: zinc ribbon domain-containing protein [candidate division Zixibacteria bacterium]|nr:zinc ribbon domain-containing protein [candidate division Zixibacteria bacterium]
MTCPECRHDNREGVRYCTRCGTSLFLLCPRCHAGVVADDLYCGECGVRLPVATSRPILSENRPTRPETVSTPPDGNGAARAPMESARKHVTVLFADISCFTALREKLDPEQVTDLMNGCLSRLADVVRKYEGHVDKFIGDCIMALFGAPIAHENDPELAVRAALEMKQVTEEYNKALPVKLEKPLNLHIGINSGMVVAGGVGSQDHMSYTVMGDTVNLASRLESLASDRQIFISKYTYNLVRSRFDFQPHDPIKVKGKTDPVPVYEVLGIRTSAGEERQTVKTPLIGRSHESVLQRALRIHRELGLNLKIIANELALSRVAMGKGDYEQAAAYLGDARSIAETDDNRSDLAKILHAEAELVARQGHDARAGFEAAPALFDELGRSRDAERVRADLAAHTSGRPA